MHGAGLDTQMARISKTRSLTFTRSWPLKRNSSATAIPNTLSMGVYGVYGADRPKRNDLIQPAKVSQMKGHLNRALKAVYVVVRLKKREMASTVEGNP